MTRHLNEAELRTEIGKLQTAVHGMTISVGGYWPPLAATARLLEEVGEVNEVFLTRRNGAALEEELSDVMIISTCLANQYCIGLHEWINEYRHPEAVTGLPYTSKALTGEWIGHFCVISGEIGRMTNAYEGIKEPKTDENTKSLGYWISLLHGHIIALATPRGTNMFDAVSNAIKAKTERDKERFSASYDPSTADTLKNFQVIRQSTMCPFARAAKLWGAPAWDRTKGIRENAENIAPHVRRFTQLQRWEVIDGFVIEITDEGLFTDLRTLGRTLRVLLRSLNALDPRHANVFEREIRAEDWQFEFNGERLFVITFAPVYGTASPRETYGVNSAFVFLQPETSFKDRNIPRDSDRQVTRGEIRKRFADVGKPYESVLVEQPYEAPRYLKPLNLTDHEMRWWFEDDE
jgi:hypothetical protein